MAQTEGPLLEVLLRRLSETPPDFLAAPLSGKAGVVDTAALVCDLARMLDAPLPSEKQLAELNDSADATATNRRQIVAVLTWLLRDAWFQEQSELAAKIIPTLCSGLKETAQVVPAERFVSDADRREELARWLLAQLGVRPLGETEAQAADRLTMLDSVARTQVMRETRAAEARARKIREAMARKAAEEAAARYSPE